MNTFKISDILSESWKKLPGVKWPIWAVILVTFAAALVGFLVIMSIGIHLYDAHLPLIWLTLVHPIVLNVIAGIFICGMIMPAIKQLRGEPISVATGFAYFSRAPQAMTFMLLVGSISAILNYLSEILNQHTGMSTVHFTWIQLASMLINLLLMLFFYLTIPLIADRNQTVFQAMGNSLRLVAPHGYKVLGIILILYFLLIIASLPLMIGLALNYPLIVFAGAIFLFIVAIWLLPYAMMLQANIYLKLAGHPQGS